MLIKNKKEIEELKKSGRQLGQILAKLRDFCIVGKSTWEIDELAEKLILKAGGKPAFKNYQSGPKDKPFPSTICACINNQIVHAPASKKVFLKDGDIFTIDIGMEKNGLFTDTARTIIIGKAKPEIEKLLQVTKESLERAIIAVKPGNSVADIGRAIEDYVNSQGKYGIVEELVGHGVGHSVHEDPMIPNYYDRKMENFKLRPGMVLAIEPMITLGDWRVKDGPGGFSIDTADGSLCAHFEHTVVVTKDGCEVITRRPEEEKEVI
ncbi:MAG TPA: type I methionyl aminopeptidase [Candidatus Magasanikbacteria bacterium]|nr:type I methionyl aminopeptidase [Candidatus Magasanikbacteria bacterium]